MKPSFFVCLAVAVLAGCAARGGSSLVPVGNAAGVTGTTRQQARFENGATVHFIVGLPLRNESELDGVLSAISDPQSPQFRHFLTREAFLERYAPESAKLQTLAANLRAAGFQVDVLDQALSVTGAQARVERFFATTFQRSGDDVLSPRAPLTVPVPLVAEHARIIGLDGYPRMNRFIHTAPMQPDNAAGAYGPYYPSDLKQAYRMPSFTEADGRGSSIGIIIDSPVSSSDIHGFFEAFGARAPVVTTVNIHGGSSPGGPGAAEAALDVEQSGGIAPGSHVFVYDLDQLSGQSIYDGYAAAVKNGVTVVNSSFGGCELEFKGTAGKNYLATFDALFKQGLASGVTFVASSGDNGSDQCGPQTAQDTVRGVNWPADSPYVLAIGGTNLVTAHSTTSHTSAYARESAQRDIPNVGAGSFWGSGGGFSVLYPRPAWQKGFVTKSARGVPDMSGMMGGLGYSGLGCKGQTCSPDDSSDVLVLNGSFQRAIGTSASSPDTAGFIALAAQIAGSKLGDVHAAFYAASKTAGIFHSGIPGNNGAYATTKARWDPVLGLGTPDAGYKLAGGKTAAGIPGTSTNP
jgi:subtilase family serine protease